MSRLVGLFAVVLLCAPATLAASSITLYAMQHQTEVGQDFEFVFDDLLEPSGSGNLSITIRGLWPLPRGLRRGATGFHTSLPR